jgi:hypothetical protein
MKVLDLQCAHQHVFEGWFGSEDDFQSQLSRGLVACPVCGDVSVEKKLSAPRFNLGATPTRRDTGASASKQSTHDAVQAMANAVGTDPATVQAMQAGWLKMIREAVGKTEDVGSKFAEVARQMHYGESEERSIRGQTTPQEAVALIEEGIEVMPLPFPASLNETLH